MAAVDRERIVGEILDLVRRDVEYLVETGKDPMLVASLLTHTLGSMRALAQSMRGRHREPVISETDVEDLRAVKASLPEEAGFFVDTAVLSGAHPGTLARRLQDAIVNSYAEEERD